MTKRKRKRAPGPGRPVTTGSQDAKPVVFRVGHDVRAALDARGKARGVSGDVEAKAIVMAALRSAGDFAT